MYIEHEDTCILLTPQQTVAIKQLFRSLWKLNLANINDVLKARELWNSSWYARHFESLQEKG